MTIEQLYRLFLNSAGVSTDSRNCPPGSIFFALKGDRFDGNDYLEQVLENGAVYAVGDRKTVELNERIIIVDDALETLQQLSNFHRKQMKATVIAITGTNGKTTTKELTAAALSSQYNTLYTQGNLNNHIGVPLTLLRMEPGHEFAVIEMGANHQGEIAELCRIAEPDYGLITNVGKAHLEGFGSFEGVIRAKSELYDYLREAGGKAFANLDNSFLSVFYPFLSVIGYSAQPNRQAFIYGEADGVGETLALTWHKGEEEHHLTTRLVGDYNQENVLAAICIAAYFNVESNNINRSIEEYVPSNNRSQHKRTEHNELIIDAYNANPGSMQAALENFIQSPAIPKMLILGEMKELGDYSREEHEHIVGYLSQYPQIEVYLIGEEFVSLPSIPASWKTFDDTAQLISYLQQNTPQGYTILIKGSRGNQLERAVDCL